MSWNLDQFSKNIEYRWYSRQLVLFFHIPVLKTVWISFIQTVSTENNLEKTTNSVFFVCLFVFLTLKIIVIVSFEYLNSADPTYPVWIWMWKNAESVLTQTEIYFQDLIPAVSHLNYRRSNFEQSFIFCEIFYSQCSWHND